MTLTRMQSQVGGMFGITRQLRRKASYLCTPLRNGRFEEIILLFGFDFFCIGSATF